MSDADAPRPPGPSLQALLQWGRRRLSAAAAPAAAPSTATAVAHLEAEVLLAHALRRTRSHLIAHADEPVDAVAVAVYEKLLARALAGEPLAYLTGEREFWSLPLQVCPAVLVPRPETELAVARCLALALLPTAPPLQSLQPPPSTPPPPPRRLSVCDLGTGSGAIACALASERPAWHIVATDRSAAALHVARANAARLGLGGIEFLQGDWFEPLGPRRFDLIVSNPPYVAADDPALQRLSHEPLGALTPGPDGTAALCTLIRLAPRHLLAGGHLVLEHGADQGPAIERALLAAGYALVRCHRDLAGHERVTEARWPTP